MPQRIKHTLFFQHPATLVWDYLTVPDLMSQWLMKSDFLPVAGHEFEFRATPMPALNFDGIFRCKVLEIVPLQKLSYSWRFGPNANDLHDSLVTWSLTEKDNGTELLLIHDAFEESDKIPLFGLLDNGWKGNMDKMLVRANAITHGTKA